MTKKETELLVSELKKKLEDKSLSELEIFDIRHTIKELEFDLYKFLAKVFPNQNFSKDYKDQS